MGEVKVKPMSRAKPKLPFLISDRNLSFATSI